MYTATLNNEKELLILASKGDEAAFTQLFYAYHNKLGAYIYHLTKSNEIAEEIVQDVFLKVWTNRAALAKVDRFGAYIYVLSRNHTLNCLRRLARERVREQKVAEDIEASYLPNEWAEPEPDYYVLIDRAVNELPPQQQKAYILRRREQLKYDEIARHMNISRETVKKYLKLARRFIISYVHTHGDLLLVVLAMTLSRKTF